MVNSIVEVEALNDSRLIVWLPDQARRLYNSGYFGKPLGISKPKDEFETPLVLDIIEGIYLLKKGLIRVTSSKDRREILQDELVAIARNKLVKFNEKFTVYADLRNRGFVVTPGIKYGCDFAVYKQGPGLDHAPFIVQVKIPRDVLSASEIVKAGRLATTVRKTFILAVIDGYNVRYLGFKWWKP